MEKPGTLNFKVGQLAEMKSFEDGFRGAWFRCKIKGIQVKKKKILPEYYDFEPAELTWEDIYQEPPYGGKSKHTKRQLMVRPQYPKMYKKSELPSRDSISQVCVVIDGTWKVGDLVDWYVDECYWSVTIVKELGNDKFQVELPMPPLGQGKEGEEGIHEASGNDFRPSLNWSKTKGWTLPYVKGHPSCGAQLLFPTNQGMELEPEPTAEGSATHTSGDKDGEQYEESVKMSSDLGMDLELEPAAAGSTTRISTEEDRENEKSVKMDSDVGMDLVPAAPAGSTTTEGNRDGEQNEKSVKTDCMDLEPAAAAAGSTTTEGNRDGEQNKKTVKTDCMDLEPAAAAGSTTTGNRDGEQHEKSLKVGCDLMESSESVSSLQKKVTEDVVERRELNIMHEDTLEAAVLDLEELVTKVKWMQRLLQSPTNDATPSSWKFV